MEFIAINEQNLDECVGVFIAAYNSPPWSYNWSQADARQYLSEYLSSPYFVGFLLYDGATPVGAAIGHHKTWWTNKQIMIDELFIASQNQQKGYGRLIMQFLENYAKDKNVELVVLMTNKYMPAFQFYLKLDYIHADQYVFLFKPTPKI
jgi:aminoglycoside 6'-N-acetyltransferase I